MTDALEKAAEILREKLPEFKIHILGNRQLGGDLLNINSGEKIAVELPQIYMGLRFTLLSELNKRADFSFSSDSRALDGACTVGKPEEVLRQIKQAAEQGKFDGLTIQYLDQNTSQESYDSAMFQRIGNGGLAQEILRQAASRHFDHR